MAVLDPDDLRRLMERTPERGVTGSRNRALVVVFAGAGLGVGEAVGLTVADVDPERRRIRVAGRRGRDVGVTEGAMETLAAWVSDRRGLGVPPDGPLFCTRDGRTLQDSYVRRLIARLGREAGIPMPLNARLLRDSYAVARLIEGDSEGEVASALGLANRAGTRRYALQRRTREALVPPVLMETLLGVAHCGLMIVRAERGPDRDIAGFVFEFVNPAAAGIAGISQDELVGAPVTRHFPEAATDGTYDRWEGLIATQGSGAGDRQDRSDGRARSFRVRRAASGDRIVLSFEDRSAAKDAERARARLAATLDALVAASDGVVMVGADRTIESANPPAERLLGVEPLLGRTFADPRWRIVGPDGRPLELGRFAPVLARATGVAVRDQVAGVRSRAGGLAWVSLTAEPLDAVGGPPYPVVLTIRDLGPSRRAEAAARSAERAVELLEESAGAFLVRCRPDGTIVAVSAGVRAVLGYPPGALVGRRCDERVVADDVEAVRTAYVRAMDSREVVHVEHAVRPRRGAPLRVRRSLRAVVDPATDSVDEVQSLIRPVGG